MTKDSIYTLINTFTPKEEGVETLLKLQLDEIESIREEASKAGWLGNDVYRATDDSQLMIVTRFRSEQAKDQWSQSPEFQAHLERIDSLLAHVDSKPVELVETFRGAHKVAPLRLAVITGSTREGRFANKPATWIAEKAATYDGFEVTEIDLRDVDLPFFGDPRATTVQRQASETFGPMVAEFDAFVFTVAEYNHSLTAVLKNALDHGEWARKPAGLVGYGGVGGARGVEHVRSIAAELEMVTMQSAVHIDFGKYLAVANGENSLAEFPHIETAAEKMLGQLLWWGRALREARLIEPVL